MKLSDLRRWISRRTVGGVAIASIAFGSSLYFAPTGDEPTGNGKTWELDDGRVRDRFIYKNVVNGVQDYFCDGIQCCEDGDPSCNYAGRVREKDVCDLLGPGCDRLGHCEGRFIEARPVPSCVDLDDGGTACVCYLWTRETRPQRVAWEQTCEAAAVGACEIEDGGFTQADCDEIARLCGRFDIISGWAGFNDRGADRPARVRNAARANRTFGHPRHNVSDVLDDGGIVDGGDL
jgi:hypothetical protein